MHLTFNLKIRKDLFKVQLKHIKLLRQSLEIWMVNSKIFYMPKSAALRENANCTPVTDYMHIEAVFINMKFRIAAI